MNTGIFTISLDFEIHWGVSDHRTVESYFENLSNVPGVVKRLLKIFVERQIHVTWATVGMLFCRSKSELFSQVSPENRPTYKNPGLSNYVIADNAGNGEKDDPFHFAHSLVRMIIDTPHQELGTHTFSHYYCLEPGQTAQQFYYDLRAARAMGEREGVLPVSIVFPRNQYSAEYLEECKKCGITSYRGNYPSWVYRAEAKSTESMLKRAARFTDSYFPLNGSRTVEPQYLNGLLNIPASCFLRPFNPKLSFLEPLRIRRIKKEMKVAAKKKKLYHLWWHPHNFGKNMGRNFSHLEEILDQFERLQKRYGMRSLTMNEICNEYNQQHNPTNN